MRQYQDTGDVLVAAFARLFGEIPPGDVAAEQLCAAPAIDGARAHYSGIRSIGAIDHRAATAAFLIDQTAASGLNFVDLGIAGTEEDDAGIDAQGDAGTKVERAREEGVMRAVCLQHDGLTFCAR